MITLQGRMKGRHHMGYGGVTQVATFALGLPAASETSFLIEGALNLLLPESEPMFYDLISRLDAIEEQIVENTENLAVSKLGNIELNAKEMEDLVKRYQHWQGSLGNLLQCPPNPFDMRPWLGRGWGGGGGVNVPVY